MPVRCVVDMLHGGKVSGRSREILSRSWMNCSDGSVGFPLLIRDQRLQTYCCILVTASRLLEMEADISPMVYLGSEPSPNQE